MIAEYLTFAKTWLHGTFVGQVPVLEHCVGQLLNLFSAPFTAVAARYHWIQLVEAVILAGLVYAAGRHVQPKGGWRGFIRYSFPKGVYRHPSALVDYQLTILNTCFGYLFNVTWRVNTIFVTALFTTSLTWMFGPAPHSLEWTTPLLIGITALVILSEDLASYSFHYCAHKIPFLWAIHKVHHSAEVLTPLTALRTHPLEYALVGSWRAVMTSFVLAPVIYLFTGPPTPFQIFGIAGTVVIFGALGDVLMHTHIWLSWGRTLNHVIFCPAMHQIHYSQAPKHWDRNFAAAFAIWDWLFGTIYIPKEREEITYGIYGERQLYTNALVAWLRPFWEMVPMRERIVDVTARLFAPNVRYLGEQMGLIRLPLSSLGVWSPRPARFARALNGDPTPSVRTPDVDDPDGPINGINQTKDRSQAMIEADLSPSFHSIVDELPAR